MNSREICKACYEINRIGFSVPFELWDMAVPKNLHESVVCLRCFTRWADDQHLEWDKDITFYPVSFVTHTRNGL